MSAWKEYGKLIGISAAGVLVATVVKAGVDKVNPWSKKDEPEVTVTLDTEAVAGEIAANLHPKVVIDTEKLAKEIPAPVVNVSLDAGDIAAKVASKLKETTTEQRVEESPAKIIEATHA